MIWNEATIVIADCVASEVMIVSFEFKQCPEKADKTRHGITRNSVRMCSVLG
jgi:hypothetical protein